MMFLQGKIVESLPCIFKDLKLIWEVLKLELFLHFLFAFGCLFCCCSCGEGSGLSLTPSKIMNGSVQIPR